MRPAARARSLRAPRRAPSIGGMRTAKIGMGALGLLLNVHCTGVPAEPVARTGAAVESTRWITATAPASAPDERLARDRQLVVDFAPPADANSVYAWLVAGKLATEPTPDPAAQQQARHVLHGGRDAPRPLVYDDIPAGDYTVCGSVDAAPLRCAHVTVTDDASSRLVVMHG